MTASHLTYPQVARAVGVTREAVRDRVRAGNAESVVIFGTPMLRWSAMRDWRKERERRANAVLKAGHHA